MVTVYVMCPDDNSPSGGIMKLYELVDTLNMNGIKSFIIHDNKNFQVSWFKNSTKTIDLESVNIKPNDLIIIPEIFAEKVFNFFPGVRKIIFNQNSFNTLKPFHASLDNVTHAYLHRDVVQVIVVSKYDFDALKWLFPSIKLSRIYYGIDDQLFYFNPTKKKIISVMPRKGREDYNFLNSLLNIKSNLQGFSIVIIDKMTIDQCAYTLRESAIFLSFSHKESFGLPPAEAMACGCIVIGYHGQGGKEFFREDLAFLIEQSDLMSYAEQVNSIIEQFKNSPEETLQIGERASQFILEKYSMANQEKSILEIIKPLI